MKSKSLAEVEAKNAEPTTTARLPDAELDALILRSGLHGTRYEALAQEARRARGEEERLRQGLAEVKAAAERFRSSVWAMWENNCPATVDAVLVYEGELARVLEGRPLVPAAPGNVTADVIEETTDGE